MTLVARNGTKQMYWQRRKDESPIVPSVETPGADTNADDAAYNLVVTDGSDTSAQFTAAITPLTRVRDITRCQDLRIDLSAEPQAMHAPSLPFINCDLNATTVDALIAEIQVQEIDCAVFYSGTAAACMLVPDRLLFKHGFPNMFTVTTLGAALQIASMVDTGTAMRGTISAGTRNGSGGSAKSGGLIALYAALGVFAFILIIVLIGGIIRVCRHPERYNTDGTGEERARGLARAMLDSVPLVRVDNSRAGVARTGAQDVEARTDGGQEEKPNQSHLQRQSSNTGSTTNSPNAVAHPERPGGRRRGSGAEQRTVEAVAQSPSAAPLPSPAVISAPAPAKVNTYAFSGGVRTPQRTPGLTPGATPAATPGLTPGYTPGQTARLAASAASPSAEAPPKYSTDGFPFPIMHEANTSLQTIDEHRPANQPQLSRSPLQAVRASQSPEPMPSNSSGRQASGTAPFTGRAASSLELPAQPPTRRKPAPPRTTAKTPQSGSSSTSSSSGSGSSSGNTTARNEKSASEQAIGVYVNQDEDVCSICFEEFQAGELLRALPCSHHFHATCVDPWLLKSSSKCPLCRTDLRNLVKNERPPAPHGHGLGHTFYFVRRRMRRVSESLRGDARPDSRPLRETAAPSPSAAGAAGATSQARSAPSFHRSHTAPAHRLLRLLPISQSTAHLLRPHRQSERDDAPLDRPAPNPNRPGTAARDSTDATDATGSDAAATAAAAAAAAAASAAETVQNSASDE